MSDIDPIRIDFTEEFRRTKRNVLFWAATTILLAAGTVASDLPIETSWAQNILLPPALLTFCSWVIMLYMFADFAYANRRLADENSPLAARIVVNGTVKTSSELARRIRLLIQPLDDAVSAAIANTKPAAIDATLPAITLVEEHLAHVRNRVDELEALPARITNYAEAVDKRDAAWRAGFYFWLTVIIVVMATGCAWFRILGSMEVRAAMAETLQLEGNMELGDSPASDSGSTPSSSPASLAPSSAPSLRN